MKNSITKIASVVLIAAAFSMVSCEREYDSPPENTLGSVITLDSLRNMYQGNPLKIEDDVSVYCTVTMDEADGNIYKQLMVEDETGGINIRTLFAGAAYNGNYLRLDLKGTVLSDYNGYLQLDSVDNDRNVIVQDVNKFWTPNTLSLQEVIDQGLLLESQLLKIDSVQFLTEQLGETYADATNQSSVNRTLVDCNGNQIIVRTSGFADFAGEEIVEGRGSLIAILTHFGGTLQLYIRSYEEMLETMTGTERCDDGTYRAIYKTDFEGTSISAEGWSTQVEVGGFDWSIQEFSNNRYAYMSNFSGGNSASETWLISPTYDLTGVTNPALEFRNAKNYSGDDVKVYVSTDFAGGPVSGATWTELSPTLSTGGFSWVSSGALDLSAYKCSSNVHIAFKYIGTDSNGATWEIDDVIIREN